MLDSKDFVVLGHSELATIRNEASQLRANAVRAFFASLFSRSKHRPAAA